MASGRYAVLTAIHNPHQQAPVSRAEHEPRLGRACVLMAAIAYLSLFAVALNLSGQDGRSGMPSGQPPLQAIMYAAMGIATLSAAWILARELKAPRVDRRRWAGGAVVLGLALANGPYLYDWYIDASHAMLGVYPLAIGTALLVAGWTRYICVTTIA